MRAPPTEASLGWRHALRLAANSAAFRLPQSGQPCPRAVRFFTTARHPLVARRGVFLSDVLAVMMLRSDSGTGRLPLRSPRRDRGGAGASRTRPLMPHARSSAHHRAPKPLRAIHTPTRRAGRSRARVRGAAVPGGHDQSAPASRYLATSAGSSTPVVAASAQRTLRAVVRSRSAAAARRPIAKAQGREPPRASRVDIGLRSG